MSIQPHAMVSRHKFTSFVLATRVVAFGLIWHILNAGSFQSWLVGVPTVAAAAWVSCQISPGLPWRMNWLSLPLFLAYFIRGSLSGGWDVALIAPGLPVRPGFIRYQTCLAEGPARCLFANVISLLPGTLAAGFDGDVLWVHVLDLDSDPEDGLHTLEQQLIRLFRGCESETS